MGNTMNYILNKKQKETISEEPPISKEPTISEETKEITAAMLLVPATAMPAALDLPAPAPAALDLPTPEPAAVLAPEPVPATLAPELAPEPAPEPATLVPVPATLALESDPPLPYRTITKDVFNEKYAISMKTSFIQLPSALRESFQTFTQGLMSESYIARNDLLNAIDDFYNKNALKCDNTNGYWTIFSAHAFNCRTYQHM
jgi:hypothetical protein